VSTGNYYTITVVNQVGAPSATAPGTYTLWVVPAAGSSQLQDTSCQTFIVDQTGKQTSLDSSGNDSTATCWP
jgi:Tfp pilus assembly protein PilE